MLFIGDDFVEETLMVTFFGGRTVACVNFTITSDAIALEGNETFTVNFVPPSGTQAGTPATSTVTLIDDDGMFRTYVNTLSSVFMVLPFDV